MNEKKKARPTAATVEQAEMGSILDDRNSQAHFTSNPAAGQRKISDLLSPGRKTLFYKGSGAV